jgi:hypothetical protein
MFGAWRCTPGLSTRRRFSCEAPNPDLWTRSPHEVASEGLTLTRRLLQEAAPRAAH